MRAGFTLLEGLIASAILLLTMAATVVLVSLSLHPKRSSELHDLSFTSCRSALRSTRRDAEGAIKLLEPALNSNATSLSLRLQRINPERRHLPETLPTPLPVNWDPYDPADIIQVEYRMVGESLWREVLLPDGSRRKSQVGEGMLGFQVTALPDSQLLVECTSVGLKQVVQRHFKTIRLRCLDRRP